MAQPTQKDQWHQEEDASEKVYVSAFERDWWIRMDRLHNSPILFRILFESKEKPKPDIESLFENSYEVYHVLHWINRNALGDPCPISLNRCVELAHFFKILYILPSLEALMNAKYQVESVFTSKWGCATHILAQYTTEAEALAHVSKLPAPANPHFHFGVSRRDDSKPYDTYMRNSRVIPL